MMISGVDCRQRTMWVTVWLRLLVLITPAWLSSVSSVKVERAREQGLPLQGNKGNGGLLPITFPIHRCQSPRQAHERRSITRSPQTLWRDTNRRESLLSKAQTKHSEEHHGKWRRAGWETMAIDNFDVDYFYYTTIQVGTPEQSLDVMLDTGSA
jgi:Eukaryotic aspartyl protease